MPIYKKTIQIVWYDYCRRATVLGEHLNASVIFVRHLIKSRGKLWRLFFWIDYAFKGIKTILVLLYHKPEHVFATSPPSLCPIFCWIYCRVFQKKLIVDAHNSAFMKPWIVIPFYKKVLQSSAVVIVHNYEYEEFLKKGFPAFNFHTLHDKIPVLESSNGKSSYEKKYFLVIVSYGLDEPLDELFKAIKLILSQEGKPQAIFKITGDYHKRLDLYDQYHQVTGIEFLGFVNFDRYDNLLQNAFGIIALTTAQMVQQCAAIEAIGATVPLITTDTDTNRRLFFRGAVLTNSDHLSIVDAIVKFHSQRPALLDGIREVKTCCTQQWKKDFATLNKLIEGT